MPTDEQALEQVRMDFADCPRPAHFTNHTHCEECAEHDWVLCSRDLGSLAIEDVGNPSWDPICFLSSEGFRYYLPALARLALEKPGSMGWYGDQFLFHLSWDGPRNRRILACASAQRRAVRDLLLHILDTRAELVDEYGESDSLLNAIEYWSEEF